MKEEKKAEPFFEPNLGEKKSPLPPFMKGGAKREWIPTGPMLGWNLLLAPKGSKARVRDDWLLDFAEFDEEARKVCQEYQLW